jgi:2-alkyl-3-oxoalkanoate reductase
MPVALLTGATGLIGGELCRLLIGQGWGVIALVRSDAPIFGNDATALPTGEYHPSSAGPSQILRLEGDIGKPNCGLDEAVIIALETQIDLVIHCAATTAFNATDAYYHQTNVAGTANMLSLAPDKPFLHISTAYVCGTQDGHIREAACSPTTHFANGYERSKAAAEALVEQSNRPWLIARPSIVVGAAEDGQIRRFDSIYAAFKLLAEGRIKTLPATVGASLNFVPIDHVALALTTLARGYENFFGTYVHLCSSISLPVTDFLKGVGTFPGLKTPRMSAPEDFDPAKLLKTERMLFERMLKHYLPYFQRNPRFAVGNLARLTGLQSPTINQDVLHRMIGYAVGAGFLRTNSMRT